jgi:hypothetical protein
MRSICWIISIVSAALVLAALDTQPDPPAINPSTTICKALQLHNYAPETATPVLCDFRRATPSSPESCIASFARETYRSSDRILLTGQASDPSPPSQTA